ncbi:MAG: intracellular growth attenuator family protein [Ectothiorhodospiraceae bacterium]|nr:intracellular growth attenuator family protein [Ectothiorhodospiraceae bacterium]
MTPTNARDGSVLELIHLLLLLIIVGSVLLALLRVMVGRRSLRLALAGFRRRSTPVRTLRDDEFQALEPLLVDPYKPSKRLTLLGRNVHELSGEYALSIIGSRDNYALQHVIGGVEVILPFDAEGFLATGHNRAQVVLTRRYAVIIRLNSDFDLLQARERDLRRQQLEDDWTSGRRGALKHVDPVAEGAARLLDVPGADTQIDGQVTVLGQRDETAAEVSARMGGGLGLLSGLLWVLAFICLAIAASVEPVSSTSRLVWLATAALLAAMGIRSFWRKRPLGRPGKVNRVRGELNPAVHESRANEPHSPPEVLLGNRLLLEAPRRWQPWLQELRGQQVNAEIRVDDDSIVSLGRTLSIDQETRQFPPVYWGRHVTLTVIALPALLLGLFISPGPTQDLRDARQRIAMKELHFSSPLALLQAAPEPGAAVRLEGQARCSLIRTTGSQQPERLDCRQLFWGDPAPSVALAEPDEATLALYTGEFLRTAMLPGTRSESLLEQPTARFRISNAAEAEALARRGCDNADDDAVASACATLKAAMAEHGIGALGEGQSAPELGSREVSRLRALGRAPARLRIERMAEHAADTIISHQRGDVVLSVSGASRATLPDTGSTAGGTLLERWEWLRDLATGPEPSAFAVTGFVTRQAHAPDGTPEMHIDAARQLNDLWAPLLRSAWLALASWLLLLHGSLALMNGWRQRARNRGLDGVRTSLRLAR